MTTMKQEYLTAAAASALFAGMTAEEISDCLTALSASDRTYARNELILHAGDRTRRMGIVLAGSVTIESNDFWGGRSILSIVHQGGFFAESYALLPEEVLLVDVRANEDCRILFLEPAAVPGLIRPQTPGQNIRRSGRSQTPGQTALSTVRSQTQGQAALSTVRSQAPGQARPQASGQPVSVPMTAPAPWQYRFLCNLLGISVRKNLQLSGRSFHTAHKTIRDRLLSYLSAVSLTRHSREFDIPFDRQQLADYLNVERTALSKELGKMRDEGLIRCRKNHFVLLLPQ